MARWLGHDGTTSISYASGYTTGIHSFRLDKVGQITEIGFKSSFSSSNGYRFSIYRVSDQVRVASTASNLSVTTGWNWFSITPVNLDANTDYVIAMYRSGSSGMSGYYKSGDGLTSHVDTSVSGFTITWNSNYQRYQNVGSDSFPTSSDGIYIPALGVNIVTPPNVAPNAPTVTHNVSNPTNANSVTLSWTLNDPDSGDGQSAYQLVGTNNGWSSWNIIDTGKVTNTTTRSYTVNITAGDGNYQFAVMTWDSAGLASPWGYSPNFYSDKTAPSITGVSSQQYVKTNSATIWLYGVTDFIGVNGVTVYVSRPDSTYSLLGIATKNGSTNDYYYNITDMTTDGNWRYDFDSYDNAGNRGHLTSAYVFRDTVIPTSPTQTNGTLFATSNGVSWSAFSDGASSSGLLSTVIYLQYWNGSAWTNVSTFPKSIAGISYSFTGLTSFTQYRWGVTYTDNASNVSVLNWTTFTTNVYSFTTTTNLTSSGYLFSKKPKFKFQSQDANDTTLTNFQIQVSTASDFSSTVFDTTSGASSTGWSATSITTGGTIYYTPQADLSIGTKYVRMRAFDGKDWGTWSTTVAFTIQSVSWATTIADDDTAISKRTIDELRTKINAVRQARGFATITWTDSVINDWNNASATDVRATHLIELRQAISDIYTALSITAPSWTDSIIDTTTIDRKGIHWTELRNAIVAC